MRLILFFLLLSPIFASAQILRAYGVIEVGSLPTSSATGPKFAYRPADSSFYRWVSGSTWVKIIPDEPDTLYLKQLSGTTALVDGDTIDISTYLLHSDTSSMLAAYIKLVGYGLIKTGQTIQVDTTSPNGLATRLFAKTLPTSIAANYAAVSNGTNLVARNLFDNDTYAGVISRPWKFGEYTTAGLPTGVTGYTVYNTTLNGIGWYDGTRWNYVPKAVKSAFTSTYIPYTNSSGQFDEDSNLFFTSTGTKKLTVPPGAAASNSNGLEFFGSNLGAGGAGFYFLNGVVNIRGDNNTGLGVGNAKMNFVAPNAIWQLNSANVFEAPAGSVVQVAKGYRDIYLDPAASGTKHVFMYGAANGNNIKFNMLETGFLALNMGLTQPRYIMETVSTDAWGLPRGTVAQRPTITTNTSPMRFNTDSTAFEYGESVGTWRQLATRAYARSLVSSLSPDTWLGTRLNAANVDINANGHELRIDSLSTLIVSAESTSTLGGAGIEQIKWLNASRTKYYNRRLHYDSRSAISGGMPAFYNLLTVNKGSGEGYEWANEMIWDTTNNIFVYGYGGRYGLGYLKFGSSRSNVAGVYLSVPRFHFYGTSSAENATADTYHTLWSESTSLSSMMMGLKDGGKFLIAADSTMIFDPSLDVPQFNKMGVGNKEAADLSKTQSNYIAGFATDGTVVEMEDLHVATTGLVTMDEYDNSASFTPNAIGEEASELFLTTSATTGKVLQRKMRETTWVNSSGSVTDDMLELAQDVFVYANCPAIATDSTVVDLPTPSVDYIGQVVEVCGDGRNATPNYQVYVRGIGATLWHQNGGADPSAQTYLEVTNLSSNHNTVRFICAQPSGSTYYWILLKQ